MMYMSLQIIRRRPTACLSDMSDVSRAIVGQLRNTEASHGLEVIKRRNHVTILPMP